MFKSWLIDVRETAMDPLALALCWAVFLLAVGMLAYASGLIAAI
jgi:hypothetical protein